MEQVLQLTNQAAQLNIPNGTKLRWSGQDEEGNFSIVGELIRKHKGRMAIQTNCGIIHIPEDDGTFEVITLGQVKKATRSEPSNKGKIKKGGKVEQVLAILREHNPSSRKEAIALIVEAGISTEAGASTHYNSAKKLLG